MSVQQSYVAAASESECGAGCVAFIGKKRRYLPAIFKFRKRLAVLCLEMSFNRDTLPSGIGSSDMLKKFRIANHLKRYENLKLDAQSAVVGETVPASWRALRATTVTPAPRANSAAAIANPSPRLPPVTTTRSSCRPLIMQPLTHGYGARAKNLACVTDAVGAALQVRFSSGHTPNL